MNTLETAKAQRAAQGLKLQWFIISEERTFTAYAKDEAQKQAWLKQAADRKWVRVN